MRRVLTITLLVGLGWLWTEPASAIDAEPKQGTTTPAAAPDTAAPRQAGAAAAKGSGESLLDKLKTQVREAQKNTQPDATDNYIDANNDGIDDRVQEQPKETPKENSKGSSTDRAKVRKAKPESTRHHVDSSKTTPKKKKRPT